MYRKQKGEIERDGYTDRDLLGKRRIYWGKRNMHWNVIRSSIFEQNLNAKPQVF